MKTQLVTVLAGVVVAVVAASVAIGLVSPDGSVGEGGSATSTAASAGPAATPSATVTTPSPSPTPAPAAPDADRAPASVTGTWPGRPDATEATGSQVDWCPAVRTTGTSDAERTFGKDATAAGACAAVKFIFEQRYSRLSLPRRSYAPKDFDFVTRALTTATAQTYGPRVRRFVTSPDVLDAAEDLGLVLLRGQGTNGSGQLSAGNGRTFYGTAFSTDGYRDRAVWVNPAWSKVAVWVDRSRGEPRLSVRLTASAALPVFNTALARDDMMTVSTNASMTLRRDGATRWRVSGWTQLASGPARFAKLTLT